MRFLYKVHSQMQRLPELASRAGRAQWLVTVPENVKCLSSLAGHGDITLSQVS